MWEKSSQGFEPEEMKMMLAEKEEGRTINSDSYE